MNIKLFVLCVVAIGLIQTKVTKKKKFEDEYERQLMDYGMGGGSMNFADSDDSGKVNSCY